MNTPNVYIAMSTYNGEKYLEAQIQSILNQTYPNIKILIRDDGSNDSTLKILKSHEKKHESIKVFSGKNKGVIESFMTLLDKIPEDADFTGFSDQDDVWFKDKVERAVSFLSQKDQSLPLMYFSRLNIVDNNLNFLHESQKINKISFENSLLENIATGCTILLNKKAVKILQGKKTDYSKLKMHDAWIYTVISAFGTIVYDNSPSINYRQHENNLIGSSKGFKFWQQRFERFKKNNKETRKQIEEFLKVYLHELPEEKKQEISFFLKMAGHKNVFKRFFYALNFKPQRQSELDSLIFRFLIVMNRI
ncbi:MAG: glycosyltransferase family 2 protein [Desulfobacteraceae bacterium]|nr:glycosyltransferase family 2 protein [Desulfobacteraceae bacterium]